ncbi:WD40-repeat-containing domain [Pseudocohnilembus persalinus]|uniref:Elongator complex protein 2 n=1 Tax=Pseudocohnilembus persalinus TaxID=266149 RepID=A0A0V0QA89_PSEPJ|nr:WD40-repeat-containing domain [Pseudocohnilembus persalinus]|eukprot:KRW98980.1 WD40-repeat-containing domain [Pseudocohnilembus persalinus]
MQVKNKLITGGVNPIYNCLAIKENAVFFGCSNQIFVYDMYNQNKVIQTLNFHKKRLNTLKFIEKSENYYLISGSADGQICLWENTSKNIFEISYKIVQKIKLEGSISFISTRYVAGQNYVLVGDCEGLVQIFKFQEEIQEEKLQKLDEIKFPEKSIIEAADLHLLDFENQNKLIISLGSLDRQIHVYIFNLKEKQKFEYKLSLSGHNDAITALNFKYLINPQTQQQYLLLASASKQHHIRLYKIQLKKDIQENIDNFDKKTSFVLDKEYYISLDSILKSHTDHVISLDWGLHNLENGSQTNENDIALISASFDFSIIVWILEDNIWVCKARLGQISGNKHAFFNAQFSSDYKHIISYTYNGALNVWKRVNLTEFRYDTINTVTGHISYVTDLDWDSGNNLLVTCSQDQTSRVFGENKEEKIWHEFSRAQIHGYDINSIKFLTLQDKFKEEFKDRDFCDLIICGADEKVLRLLEPPAHFVNFVNTQSKTKLRLYIPNKEEEEKVINQEATQKSGILQYKTQTEGGLQVLGLMTKNVAIREKISDYHDYTQYEGEENQGGEKKLAKAGEGESEINFKVETDYKIPPSEDFLEKHTLWPEINKFYGHGYEISCLTSNHKGSVIVSACKSQTKDQSMILFYDPKTYAIVDRLSFHNYTIQQLEFSHDDELLASVSRDRYFALFKLNKQKNKYELYFSSQSHTRIIWSLAFTHDSKFLATGSRDNRFKIWKINNNPKNQQNQNENQNQKENEKCTLIAEKVFKKNPVTAVAFSKHQGKCQKTQNLYYLMAVGFENGLVEVYKFFDFEQKLQQQEQIQQQQENKENNKLVLVGQYPSQFEHSNIVKRIKFRKTTSEVSNVFEIASCSSDHSMRLLELTIE